LLPLSGNRGKAFSPFFRGHSLLHQKGSEGYFLGVLPPDRDRFQKNNKLFIRQREKYCYNDQDEAGEKTSAEREKTSFPQRGEGFSINRSYYA
ncbi:MAG: hypothetical protein IJC26_04185, partial [Clostridia bacterium]|nr:hypothetical protein [Clostridia bacterium]